MEKEGTLSDKSLIQLLNWSLIKYNKHNNSKAFFKKISFIQIDVNAQLQSTKGRDMYNSIFLFDTGT